MKTVLYVLPVFGVTSVLVGAFVSASGSALYARVESGPRANNGALSFQIEVGNIDGEFRTASRGLPLVVHATYKEETARREVVTNDEGIAEANFEFFGSKVGTPVELIVTNGEHKEQLARATGEIWKADHPKGTPTYLAAVKREGELVLDVVVEGQLLAPSIERKGWVRIRRGEQLVESAAVMLDGEEIDVTKDGDLCAPGWARFTVTSRGLAPLLRVRASLADDTFGTWEGALPQLQGSGGVRKLESVPPDTVQRVEITSANERELFYVEVYDRAGRAYATTMKLGRTGNEIVGKVELPALARGPHWISVTGDSSATAETAVSPFIVAAERPTCGDEAELSALPAPPRARRLFADSSDEIVGHVKGRKALGKGIAVLGLFITGLLEFMVFRSELEKAGGKTQSVVPVVLVAIGFVLLAVLVISR